MGIRRSTKAMTGHRIRSVAAVCSALTACSAAATPVAGRATEPRAAQIEPLDLTVRVRAERDGQKWGVAIDDKVKTGDFLELFVNVNQPAYIYAVQFYPDGTSAVLFPGAGDCLLPPGAEHRIPVHPDESFQLEPPAGEENIYVAASRQPIASVDSRIASALDEIRTSPGPSLPAPEPVSAVQVPPAAPAPPAAALPPASGTAANGGPAHRAPPDVKRHRDRFLTAATRRVRRVKRPDQAPAIAGTADRHDDALLILRFSLNHE